MNPTPIYLDNNASTQAAPEVVACVAEVMGEHWGNPSSLHGYGARAAKRVKRARAQVAALLGARSPGELVFTSGGTESINSAIHASLANSWPNALVITSNTEHPAVTEPLARLEQGGRALQRLAVDAEGHLDPKLVLAALDAAAPHCALLSLQWANNESGALMAEEAIVELAARCRQHGTLFHLDAVQIPGKRPIDVQKLGVDLLSISSHKFHGPQGVGALYLRSGALDLVSPLILGGPQEAERRGGTQNVAGIAGMGLAAELAQAHVESLDGCAQVRALRDELEAGLLSALPGSYVHGSAAGSLRLDNTCSIFIPSVDAQMLLSSLASEGLAISSGAACSSSKQGPSHVLLAMGLNPEVASGSLRFSLSRMTSGAEIRLALELIHSAVEELFLLSPPAEPHP